MKIPTDTVLSCANLYLDNLTNEAFTLAQTRDLEKQLKHKREESKKFIWHLLASESKHQDDIMRCYKLVYKVYSCLYFFTRYICFFKEEDRQKMGDLAKEWSEFIPQLKFKKEHAFIEERLLLQALKVFSLLYITEATLLANKPSADIMAATLHLLSEYQIYRTVMYQEILRSLGNPAQKESLSSANRLSKCWFDRIETGMQRQRGYSFKQPDLYSESDRIFLNHWVATHLSRSDVQPIPTFYVLHFQTFNVDDFAQRIRCKIAESLIATGTDAKIDEAIKTDALRIGQLLSLKLKLEVYIQENSKNPKINLDREKKLYAEMLTTLEECIPLLNLYRYFLRLSDPQLCFLDIEVVRNSPWFQSENSAELNYKEVEIQSRLSTFAMLAQVSSSADPEENRKRIGRWCNKLGVADKPFKYIELAYVSEETETKLLPTLTQELIIKTNLLLSESIQLYYSLAEEKSENNKIRLLRPYFKNVACNFSRLKNDFNLMTIFFLLCKKCLAFQDQEFTSEIHYMLEAYAANEPKIAIFAPARSVEELVQELKTTEQNKPKPAKPKKPAATTKQLRQSSPAPSSPPPSAVATKSPRNECPVPKPIVEAAPPIAITDLGSYLTTCNRESSRIPMNCLPVQEILEALNSQATPDNNYKGASFLYGGAPLALALKKDSNSIKDWDLMIHNCSLTETRDFLLARQEKLGISSIELVGKKHQNLIIKMKDHPSVVVEISAMPIKEDPGDSNDNPKKSLFHHIRHIQKKLDYKANSLFYTRCGGRDFLIDTQGALRNLLRIPPLLQRTNGEQELENIGPIILRGIKFLVKHPEFTIHFETLRWMKENATEIKYGTSAYHTFIKLLYSGRAHDILVKLEEFGLLKIMFPKTLSQHCAQEDFMAHVKKFDEEYSHGMQHDAETQYQAVCDRVKAYFHLDQAVYPIPSYDSKNFQTTVNHPAGIFGPSRPQRRPAAQVSERVITHQEDPKTLQPNRLESM